MPSENVGSIVGSCVNKTLLKADINDFSLILRNVAEESPKMAMKLFGKGLLGDINPGTLRALGADAFESNGKLAPKATDRLIEFAESFGFTREMTINDALRLFKRVPVSEPANVTKFGVK